MGKQTIDKNVIIIVVETITQDDGVIQPTTNESRHYESSLIDAMYVFTRVNNSSTTIDGTK